MVSTDLLGSLYEHHNVATCSLEASVSEICYLRPFPSTSDIKISKESISPACPGDCSIWALSLRALSPPLSAESSSLASQTKSLPRCH